MFNRLLICFALLTIVRSFQINPGLNLNNLVVRSSEKDWWQTATVYQIYPRSFKDSDGDGVGDLQGIINKLDYIESLGVDAIWLSPIFKSPQLDGGYDISDFREIGAEYGTLSDFITLIEESHNRNIKLVLDFVPNHSSDQHEWFIKSANKTPGYEDYYIWHDGKLLPNGTKVPPNNWLSVFMYSAWEWHEGRQQYYLHQFLKEQPDLNYRNEKVQQEMKDILSFWLDTHQVDGARIDAVPHIYEIESLDDEPSSNDSSLEWYEYDSLEHTLTKDRPETFELVYDWRTFFDNITNSLNASTKIIMTECSSDLDSLVKYHGNNNGSVLGAHFSFNFWLQGLTKVSTAENFGEQMNSWFDALPSIYTFNWLLGNHDNPRVATRVGVEKADGMNMLVSFLPGVQITYSGEEIAMENGNVTCEQGKDIKAQKDNCTHYDSESRDFERTPFQWDNTSMAGFTDGNETWLPVSDKYTTCNVAQQQEAERSHLKLYIELQKLRKKLEDQDQVQVQYPGGDGSDILQVTRYNFDDSKNPTNVYDYLFNLLGTNATDVTISNVANTTKFNVVACNVDSPRNIGDTITGNTITLAPYESLILEASSATSVTSCLLLLLTMYLIRIF